MARLIEKAHIALHDWVRNYVRYPDRQLLNEPRGCGIFRQGAVVTVHLSGVDRDELLATTVPDWALPNWAVHAQGWKHTGGYVRLLSSGKFTIDEDSPGYLACTFTYLARNP